jgi:hypothetical protein
MHAADMVRPRLGFLLQDEYIYIYIYIYIYQKWILSHCSLNLHGLKLVDIDSYFFFLSFFFLVSNHGSAPCVCVRE